MSKPGKSSQSNKATHSHKTIKVLSLEHVQLLFKRCNDLVEDLVVMKDRHNQEILELNFRIRQLEQTNFKLVEDLKFYKDEAENKQKELQSEFHRVNIFLDNTSKSVIKIHSQFNNNKKIDLNAVTAENEKLKKENNELRIMNEDFQQKINDMSILQSYNEKNTKKNGDFVKILKEEIDKLKNKSTFAKGDQNNASLGDSSSSSSNSIQTSSAAQNNQSLNLGGASINVLPTSPFRSRLSSRQNNNSHVANLQTKSSITFSQSSSISFASGVEQYPSPITTPERYKKSNLSRSYAANCRNLLGQFAETEITGNINDSQQNSIDR